MGEETPPQTELQAALIEQRRLAYMLRDVERERSEYARLQAELADAKTRLEKIEEEHEREIAVLKRSHERRGETIQKRERALEAAAAERAEIAEAIRRVEASRSWRYGRRMVGLLQRLVLRRRRRETALDRALARLEAPLPGGPPSRAKRSPTTTST
jgi:hypothetical protein